jgi:two-component system CheB/CheR fusion protein
VVGERNEIDSAGGGQETSAREASTEASPMPSATATVPILGIGASAGGLEAFQVLVATMADSHRLALVLIQHLDPDHESLLPELLAKRTSVPVQTITDGVEVE